MKVSMISAMARRRVIGTGNGGIPWRLPRDSRHFRSYTNGKYLLLGRTTYEEMSGWFTDHHPIVLSRDPAYHAEIGSSATNIHEAIEVAKSADANELVVCGGASIYHAALPFTEELVLTLIDADVDGSAYFPDYSGSIEWETLSEEQHEADEENEFAMTFLHLRRIAPPVRKTPS